MRILLLESGFPLHENVHFEEQELSTGAKIIHISKLS